MIRRSSARVISTLAYLVILSSLVAMAWYSISVGGLGPSPVGAQSGQAGPSFEATVVILLLTLFAGFVGGTQVTLKFNPPN